jgi:branched-chain amino acid transport system ATP-binding protein
MAVTELRLRNVVAGYAGTTVLEGVDLSLRQGERVGILGRNGAGKTTTLATALGFTQVLGGVVEINGLDVARLPVEERVRLGIGYVPQTRDIFPSLTVEENLLAGMYRGKKTLIDEAYELFPRLRERRSNLGNQLSGGEQQMLSIARALMGQPNLLLLDEPLEGLSPLVATEVMNAVKRLVSARSLGCILVEQHVSAVLDFATRVLVLERGRPAFHGSTEALLADKHILESCIGLRKAT